MTTEEAWRLARTREAWRELRGEPDDAARAARSLFDSFCRSADRLVLLGYLDRWPRWLRGA